MKVLKPFAIGRAAYKKGDEFPVKAFPSNLVQRLIQGGFLDGVNSIFELKQTKDMPKEARMK